MAYLSFGGNEKVDIDSSYMMVPCHEVEELDILKED
jgi:hypothetical protein